MEKIDPRIELVIYRFLRGELSASEREMLESWLREGRHRELFEKICNKENMLEKSFYFDRLDKGREKTWLRLERATGLRRRLVMRRWAVAASLMVPLLIGIMYLNMRQVEPGVPELRQERIVPGVSTAQLYLPDGKVVDLGKDSICDLQLFEGGRFVNERGTLTYKSDSAEISAAQYSEIRIPRGGEYKVVLPDGTVVWLNAESSLRFPTVFTGKERKVYAKGELYFDVKHDEAKPFIVEAKEVDVRVLGTSFNVMSYDDEFASSVTLLSRKVETTSGHDTVRLSPGEQVSITSDNRMTVQKTDINVVVSWMDGKFGFSNERLDVIMRKICRWYDVEVLYAVPGIRERRFTGAPASNMPLKELLEALSTTTNLQFSLRDGMITIKQN
mgnify:CR=1 FL=1